ncbi:hypothetical protein [Sharpea azabuensis]|uniref:hypothetical protein n=1 Tax=Sharpea azabuensis TaxID=322505 RepID=UPI00051B8998|nr:hypothetical protein [Sharpea azabuensis]
MIFICPKNFKSGKYIFGKYRPIDLAILILGGLGGLIVGLVLLNIAMVLRSLIFGISAALIGGLIILVSAGLVLKINYYHNVLEWILTAIQYYTRNREYRFRGIAYADLNEDKEEVEYFAEDD